MDDGSFTLSSRADVAVWAGELESLTWNVMLNVPESAVVPEITPEVADKLKPAGKEPEPIDQL